MMALEAIQAIDREKAAQAAQEGLQPFVMSLRDWKIDLDLCKAGQMPETLRQIPQLGDFRSPQWKHVETFFVDKGVLSGLWDAGQDFIPPGTLKCLSVGEFATAGYMLTDTVGACGWALHSEGMFQIHASAYRRATEEEQLD